METILIKPKSKADIRFWLELAKKTGNKAKVINTDDLEDVALATLIKKGMDTPLVSRSSVMKVLGK